MATKKTAKSKKRANWSKNSKDYAAKQKARAEKRGNVEDAYVGSRNAPSRRILDYGQAEPKGYMRTGGRYFAKISNMRPIKSKTSKQQRALFYDNRERYLGVDGKGGYVGSAAHQGMYNGDKSEINFRKTAGARKLIDSNGGTYPPEYYDHFTKDGKRIHTKGKKYTKSRYIMAIGQDGHMR